MASFVTTLAANYGAIYTATQIHAWICMVIINVIIH